MSMMTLTRVAAATDDTSSTRRLPLFMTWAEQHGAVIDADGMDVEDAILAGGLDYTVKIAETLLSIHNPDGTTATVQRPGFLATYAVWPDDTITNLGDCKSRYGVVQNDDGFSFAQNLINDHGANVVAASKYGTPMGSKTFMALRLDDQSLVAAETDPHDLYVVVRNSHDGSSRVSASVVAIRRASDTDVTIDLAHAPMSWKLTHSGDLRGKFAEAEQTMHMVRTWIDHYRAMSVTMLH